jgi:hypothetical protein
MTSEQILDKAQADVDQAKEAAYQARTRLQELTLQHGSAEEVLKVLAHLAVNLDQDVTDHLRRWS